MVPPDDPQDDRQADRGAGNIVKVVQAQECADMSELGLRADTCRLLSKHGTALEADHAARIAGSARKTGSIRETAKIP